MQCSTKKITAIVLAAIIFATSLCSCKIKSADNYYENDTDLTGKDVVSIEIQAKSIQDNMDNLNPAVEKILPQDGVILKKTDVELLENETALDILIKAAKKNKIALNINGSGASSYIVGINGIKEFDCGELSGWIYLVNDDKMSVGCGGAKVKKDDVIQFIYTCNLGEDV